MAAKPPPDVPDSKTEKTSAERPELAPETAQQSAPRPATPEEDGGETDEISQPPPGTRKFEGTGPPSFSARATPFSATSSGGESTGGSAPGGGQEDAPATNPGDAEGEDDQRRQVPWTRLARQGVPADIRALDALPTEPTESATGMSANLIALLRHAARVSQNRDTDGFSWVDEESIWRALFSPGLEIETWDSNPDILMFVRETLPKLSGAPLPQETGSDGDTSQEDTPQAALTPDIINILSACEGFLADIDPKEGSFICARHFLFAMMGTEGGAHALLEAGILPGTLIASETALTDFWQNFTRSLGDHVMGQLYQEEGLGWQFVIPKATNNPPRPRLKSRITPSYLADSRVALPTLSNDPLGAVRDAAALSELICLEAASPPLAVGLFGNWGSGKTTFMQVLQREIDSIAAEAAERRKAGDDLPFVENVVHVWFNAWTFADKGNLWASIATELFRQLSVGGWDGRNRAVTTKYLEQVRTAVETGGAEVDQNKAKLETIETDLRSKRQEAAEVEAEIRDVEAHRTTDRVVHLLDNIPMPNAPDVKRAMAELGLPSAGDTPKPSEVVAAVRDLKGLNAEVTALRRSLFVGDRVGRNWSWLALIALLGVVAFYLADRFGPLLVERIGLNISGYFVGTALALGGWLIRGVQMVKKVLGPLTAAETEIGRKQREALKERQASIASEITRLRGEQDTAQQELRDSRERASSLDTLIEGKDERLLAYFIRERWETGGWREHLGVVAMVQEAIEELSVLLQEDGRKFEANIADGDADGKPAPIQRIVLYIDDLDRCHPKQVAEVLQAVHLLLAYPVFVVVVGVDPDWLSTSLVKVYPEQIGKGADSGEDGAPHATVADYLEKIFQIPYWLRPLSEADDGRYRLLVNRMIGREPDANLPPQPHDEGSGSGGPGGHDPGSGIIDLTRFALEDRNPPPPPVVDRDSADIWEGVQLTDAEVKLMEQLGPLAGKSPRAVKRFVNIYRLIRTRAQGDPDFLNGSPATWPAAMFLLALDVGQPVERQDEFHRYWEKQENDAYVVGIVEFWLNFESVTQDVQKLRDDPFWTDTVAPSLKAVGEADDELQTRHLKPRSAAARAVQRFSMGRLSE